MEKSVIKVSCNDQVLKITEASSISAGGLNEVRVVFNFCEKWAGFTKTAIFYRSEENVYYAVLDENDTCIIPWEVCYEVGTFYFGVFGEKDDIRRTSSVVRCKVKKGAFNPDLKPSDPTPDIYNQIIGIVNENKSVTAAFVADMEDKVESGYFDGEDGDDGYTPIRGTDYWTADDQKTILDKCCVSFEESGAIVTCEPVEGYPLEVVSNITTTDAGCTGVKLWRCGKNMLPFPYTHFDTNQKEWDVSGVAITINDDGSITLKGTATADVMLPRLVQMPTGLSGVVCGQYTFYDSWNGFFFVLIPPGTTVDTTIYPQLEYGDVATDYEPYRGEEFTVDFGRTVYGGSFNWKTGVLTTSNGEQFQYEPQEILGLSGMNTLYSSTGDTTVTGRTDPTAVIEKLTNAIIALGGNV